MADVSGGMARRVSERNGGGGVAELAGCDWRSGRGCLEE